MGKRSIEVSTRPLIAEDFAAYRALTHEADVFHFKRRPKVFKSPRTTYPTRKSFAALRNDPNVLLIGAEVNGTVVGYVHAMLFRSWGARIYRKGIPMAGIDLIVVTRRYRRRGIAHALMSAAAAWARARKARSLSLGVFAFNQEAIAFYRKFGFESAVQNLELKLVR